MRIRCSVTLISTLLLTLCLVALIPGALRFASTWRELYFDLGDHKENNLLMPLGFFSLGFQAIGLIVLWTGYQKKERWAWVIMFIILLLFVFPPSALTLLLTIAQTPSFEWNDWFRGIREGAPPSIGMATGVLDFLAMLVALLLPVRAFFWPSKTPPQVDGARDVMDGKNEWRKR